MERTTMHVDGRSYALAQGQDTAAIAGATIDAARAGAGLVAVTVYGNRAVEVLIVPGAPVAFETEHVVRDDRDDGDLGAPFDVHQAIPHQSPRAFDEHFDEWDL